MSNLLESKMALCLDVTSFEDVLTLCKHYEVIGETDSVIYISDDTGHCKAYFKDRFVVYNKDSMKDQERVKEILKFFYEYTEDKKDTIFYDDDYEKYIDDINYFYENQKRTIITICI